MKKFNKVLALGMAGSMALSMAACGGSSSSASTGTDGSSTSTAAPTAAPSKDVVTLKWVAVGSGIQIAERYKGELLTGTADPEVMVPQMMKELRAAGFDKIVAEAQSQVDAFMATNK